MIGGASRNERRVPPITVYVATKNTGKRAELEAIFGYYGWVAVVFPGYRDVVEGESSYAENAALKARGLRRDLARDGIVGAVVGDDSGLEVRALRGRPGVLSARYGGDATWADRRAMLLAEVAAAAPASRAARFVCALHYIAADGTEIAVEATLDGSIAETERGDGGFSYDAIFRPDGDVRTFAEYPEVEKNACSHRALAVARLVQAVDETEANPRRTGT
ncbi:MAG: RdgB/HAM1 family non-canonical purine NTP pyrophosphatase [Vulcanimicrobiaceae bacterium]